jgi:hypothetical protein
VHPGRDEVKESSGEWREKRGKWLVIDPSSLGTLRPAFIGHERKHERGHER